MSFVYSTIHSSKEKSVDFTNSSHDGIRWMRNPLSSFVLLPFFLCEYLRRGNSGFVRENESKADKLTKMSDSSRNVDKDKGNWGHVRVALGCVCIFPNRNGWQTCGSHLRSLVVCCALLCVYPGFASLCHMTCHESQQSYNHPASVIELLVLSELQILDLGSKKKTTHNLWIYFYICPMFLFMKVLGTAVLYDIYLALKHLSCRFMKLGSLYFFFEK